jgi:hypothetical protein
MSPLNASFAWRLKQLTIYFYTALVLMHFGLVYFLFILKVPCSSWIHFGHCGSPVSNCPLMTYVFLGSLIADVLWIVWKTRNDIIFKNYEGLSANSLYFAILYLFTF